MRIYVWELLAVYHHPDKYCDSGDTIFFNLSRNIKGFMNQMWNFLMVRHQKFGWHGSSASGD